MSNETETKEPAFPRNDIGPGHNGMTLRDYFAAKAMHQFLRGSVIPPGYDAAQDFAGVAARAYEIADAMLESRK